MGRRREEGEDRGGTPRPRGVRTGANLPSGVLGPADPLRRPVPASMSSALTNLCAVPSPPALVEGGVPALQMLSGCDEFLITGQECLLAMVSWSSDLVCERAHKNELCRFVEKFIAEKRL